MTRIITTDEITTTIRAVVAEYGSDFVYVAPVEDSTSCYYRTPVLEEDEDGLPTVARTEGKPGCIVGHVLDRLGLLPAVLYPSGDSHGTPEQRIEDRSAGSAMSALEGALDVRFEGHARYALGTAQGRQDKGLSWGDALTAYEDRIRVA